MARNAADLLIGKQLAVGYRLMAFSVSKDALLAEVGGKPLHARRYRRLAVIARRAAVAEEVNPDTAGLHGVEPVACRICGGESVCIS